MSDLNVNYVRKQLQTSGFSEAVLQDLPQRLAEGLPEVKITEAQVLNDIPIVAEAVLKQGEKPENYFYNGYLAKAFLPVHIKHPSGLIGPYAVLEGTNNLYIDTRTLESELAVMQLQRLSQAPEDPVYKVLKLLDVDQGKTEIQRSFNEVNRDLHLLMTKEPSLFTRLMAQYEPPVDFEISDKLAKRQQQIQSRHRPFQYFKSKYGIGLHQAANMLAHKVWVYLKLQHEKTGEEYGSWHKINFEKLTPSGNHEYDKAHDALKYVPENILAGYAFKEFDLPDPRDRQAALRHVGNQLRQGDLPVLTPVNPDLPQVRVGANPMYNSIQIFSMLMQLQKHEPYRISEKATLIIQDAAGGMDVPEGIIAPGTPTRDSDSNNKTTNQDLGSEKKNSKGHNRRLRDNQATKGEKNSQRRRGNSKGIT